MKWTLGYVGFIIGFTVKFPKIRGTFWAVPIIRTILFWDLYWGVDLGKGFPQHQWPGKALIQSISPEPYLEDLKFRVWGSVCWEDLGGLSKLAP